jgi:predicted transcriptional regulator
MPPKSPKRAHPTKLELTLLRVLWREGPCSVRQVYNILNAESPIGYTTVLKIFQIMTEKGLVERDESVRPQIYRARHSEEQTQRSAIRDLIDRVYGGSIKTLVLHALPDKKSSAKDLEAIMKHLVRIERGDK